MTDWLIVGGGIAGLLAAREIRALDCTFLGVEKADELGGRAAIGPHRVYSEEIANYIAQELPPATWEFVDDKPLERQKGDWLDVRCELSAPELLRVRTPFYRVTTPFTASIAALRDKVSDGFRFHSHVEVLNVDEKSARLGNGDEIRYEKLAWCAPLDALSKLLREKMPRLPKAARSKGAPAGGVTWEMRVKGELFPTRSAAVLSFRYKEHRLRVLGFSGPGQGEGETTVSWVLALDKDLVDDREEIAKCVRTMKREIGKEFPDLASLVQGERIISLPSLLVGPVPAISSLELLPDLFYLGAELRLEGTSEDLGNLDLAIANHRAFSASLRSAGEPLPERTSKDAVQQEC